MQGSVCTPLRHDLRTLHSSQFTHCHRKIDLLVMEIEAAQTHNFDYLDDATAILILQLEDRDIQEFLDAGKGKGRDRDGLTSDADLAMAIYQQELQQRHAILADRCMSRSITDAVMTDAALLRESSSEEDTASKDRALAQHLATDDNAMPDTIEHVDPEHPIDDGVMARLGALYVWGRAPKNDKKNAPDEEDLNAPESSAWATSRGKPAMTASRQQCSSCLSDMPLSDVFRAPCGDHYCLECLQTLFEMATTDENLYPPRCC